MKSKYIRIISLLLSLLVAFSSLALLTSCRNEKGESSVNSDNNYVNFAEGFTEDKVIDEESALKTVENIAAELGIMDVSKEVAVTQINTVGEDKYYRMQQYYDGMPVYGHTIVLSANGDGVVQALTSNTEKIELKNDSVKKTLDEAKNIVKMRIKEDSAYAQSNVTVIAYDPMIVVRKTNDGYVKTYHLMASVLKENGYAIYKEFFVNVETGKVEKEFDLKRSDMVDAVGKDNIGVDRSFRVNKNSNGSFVLEDIDRNFAIYNAGEDNMTYVLYAANGTIITEKELCSAAESLRFFAGNKELQKVTQNQNVWSDTKAVTLAANLQSVYDFFAEVLKIEGTNGEKNIIHAFYNDNNDGDTTNAYCWSSWEKEVVLSFGTDNSIPLDTVGHEYMHGVEQSISAMDYEGESGAIMEAYSDIFGELIQDFTNDGFDNDCDWVHGNRNMIDPGSQGVECCHYELMGQSCPVYAKYGKHIYNDEKKFTESTCWALNPYPEKHKGEGYVSTDIDFDYGGVHINNTVLTHAAYLMANGIDGAEQKKISTDQLAELWYRGLLMLQSDATFKQCANAIIVAAQQMFTDDAETFTTAKLNCVKEAFAQVGITANNTGTVSLVNGGRVFAVDAIHNKMYDNYHIKVERIDLKTRKIELVVETDVTDDKGYLVDLEDGTYIFTVSDNAIGGSEYEYSKSIRVFESTLHPKLTTPAISNSKIYIYTDFEVEIPIEDFSTETDMTITLGELGVIEPEITPADATSYSIKWSSSDESVATVSPNGEAGIITTLAKGTTTITAELTSGGKTITKTTNLRVASKARDTVLVLDVSGSMYGNPLDEMKKSAIQFCNDLLKDEYNNRVGIVFYDDGISTIDLTDDLDMLVSRIQSISDGGRTNMEAGLSAADKMLKNSGKSDSIKNVVVMADGLPNEGKTSYSGSMPSGNYSGYYTSVSYANAVIDTAKAMMNNYNLYSLGFFHSLYSDEKDFATALMKELTNQADGYHQVDKAEDLQFAFGDISEDINVGSKIVINIACPVDVRVSHGGEMLSSSSSAFCNATSFGTLQLLGKNKDIKVVSLDSDKEYEVELVGTGVGKMDYSVNYFDEKEQLSDYRSFETVPITMTTVIKSNTDNSVEDIALNIDEDGDGEIDVIWTASAKSKGEITYEKNPPEPEEPEKEEPPVEEKEDMSVWAIVLICVFAFVLVGGGIVAVVVSTKKSKSDSDADSEFEIPEHIPMNIVMCSRCGKTHPSNHPCECWNEQNKDQITEDAERSTGFIQVTNGSMNGFSVPIKDGETLYLGKDPKFANLVFTGDYKNVSRMHCAITFDAKANRYFVTDSSSNGTYLISKKRLIKGKRTPVNINTVLILANDECTVLLG